MKNEELNWYSLKRVKK